MKKKKIKPSIDQRLLLGLRGTSIQKKPSVQGEVQTFNLYGELRKAATEIHNSLPSPQCKYSYLQFKKSSMCIYWYLGFFLFCEQLKKDLIRLPYLKMYIYLCTNKKDVNVNVQERIKNLHIM
jgi:hypothetical protein